MALGAGAHWQGTWTAAGGSATLAKTFYSFRPWLHGQQEYTIIIDH